MCKYMYNDKNNTGKTHYPKNYKEENQKDLSPAVFRFILGADRRMRS